jgi:hypothetical protein
MAAIPAADPQLSNRDTENWLERKVANARTSQQQQ